MRRIYKREALLLDDGKYVSGYTAKKKFYPVGCNPGFSYQKFRKNEIGKTIFYANDMAKKMQKDLLKENHLA